MEGSRVRLCRLGPSDGKEFIDVLGGFVSESLGFLGSCGQCWTLDVTGRWVGCFPPSLSFRVN